MDHDNDRARRQWGRAGMDHDNDGTRWQPRASGDAPRTSPRVVLLQILNIVFEDGIRIEGEPDPSNAVHPERRWHIAIFNDLN